MTQHRLVGLFASIAVAVLPLASALAFDETRYPDLKGQWTRLPQTGGQWDPNKPPGRGQQAPFTAEYQAIYEAGVRDYAAGGHGNNTTPTCMPPGMPRAMIVYEPMEIIVRPEVTYIHIEYMSLFRRIYTDGRPWPDPIKPTFGGYSIGQWIDDDGDGRFDTLMVETRGMKGPRTFEGSMPLHKDNQTIVKERLFLDKAKEGVLRNEVTTIDNALTRPWTVTRSYSREPTTVWHEYPCAELNEHVFIGKDNYLRSADGHLMPARKGQSPPDLRHFNQAQK